MRECVILIITCYFLGNRQLQPTPTGVTLIHGYLRLDPDLALPDIRANIEKYIALVCVTALIF